MEDFAPSKEFTSQFAISSNENICRERDSILDSKEFREMLSLDDLKTNLKEKERLSTLTEDDGSQASNIRKSKWDTAIYIILCAIWLIPI